MKRSLCLLLILLLLMGCQQKHIAPSAEAEQNHPMPTWEGEASAIPTHTRAGAVLSTTTPSSESAAPAPTDVPEPPLATFPPRKASEPFFAEELLTQEGDPICSRIYSMLTDAGLSKSEYLRRFQQIIREIQQVDVDLRRISAAGRTLTASRREKTAVSLMKLLGDETAKALQEAYARCAGDGEELPLVAFSTALDALVQDVMAMEARTTPFFELGSEAVKAYKDILSRKMGETFYPRSAITALEELAQTEAYALSASLQADPEAGRRKTPISNEGYGENITFLYSVTNELCPLPDGSTLPFPAAMMPEEQMDLLELAYRQYPGLAFLDVYAAHAPTESQARWEKAPEGYRKGLAIHASYAVVPYLEEAFGLEYVQYRWYEKMVDMTLTGISALLIHSDGYSKADLSAYLAEWGAADFTDYLYGKAMDDPFDSIVAPYGYSRYLEICQAALDTGCGSERQFLQDYLSAGPAPFEALKEYMVRLYEKQG